MRLTATDLAEFKALFHKHYGRDLSDADAYDRASRLLRLCKAVYLVKKTEIKREEICNPGQSQSKTTSNGSA